MREEQYLNAVMGMRTKLYHTARAILWNDQDAADAVQDAMLKGWKCRFMLRSEDQFEAWFMRILVNRCRDLQRKQIRDKKLIEEMLAEEKMRIVQSGTGDAFEVLRLLPEELKLPTLLYYYEGYSQKDIGRILSMPAEKVKMRIRQARVKMKKMLSEGGELQ